MMLLASNSAESINRTLLDTVSKKIDNAQINYLTMSDFDLPFYGIDTESNDGIPEPIQKVKKLFSEQDAFVIACPEHNGSMPAVFKNFVDWLSRAVDQGDSIFSGQKVLLLSTSPGARGGVSNLQNLVNIMPYWGAEIVGSHSIGSYFDNYKDSEFTSEHDQKLTELTKQLIESLTEKAE